MGELDAGMRALRMQKACNAGQRRNVLILPNAQVDRGDAAFRRDRRCLKDYQPGPALGARAEMNKMPVRSESVFT